MFLPTLTNTLVWSYSYYQFSKRQSMSNNVLPLVALKLRMKKMPCHPNKTNCHKSKMWLQWKEHLLRQRNVHLKAILFVKCGCPYLYKSPCKSKIPEAIMNEIRVASVRRPWQSKREAARQLTSYSNNAQNTVFRFQSYKYDFFHYAVGKEFYWWSLRHYFWCFFIAWTYGNYHSKYTVRVSTFSFLNPKLS